MNRARTIGLVVTPLALLGYAIGVVEVYPGRSLTLVGIMVGITLLAMGDGS